MSSANFRIRQLLFRHVKPMLILLLQYKVWLTTFCLHPININVDVNTSVRPFFWPK